MNYEQLKWQNSGACELPSLRILDKNGHFYHVVQRASNHDNIFYTELARYRHNLLCRLCAMHNVTIIASVVMNNHTHDILMADALKDISTSIRLVNTEVAHYVRKKSTKKYTNGRRVFETFPFYRAIHDIVDLMTTIKYTFDNMKLIEDKGGIVPFSCFWNMSKGYLSRPYNKNLYSMLFSMTEIELYNFLNEHDMQQVVQISRERFQHWTAQDNAAVFKVNPDIPWLTV